VGFNILNIVQDIERRRNEKKKEQADQCAE
jgi:hypothetical protein